jgi:hypothetical protein
LLPVFPGSLGSLKVFSWWWSIHSTREICGSQSTLCPHRRVLITWQEDLLFLSLGLGLHYLTVGGHSALSWVLVGPSVQRTPSPTLASISLRLLTGLAAGIFLLDILPLMQNSRSLKQTHFK